MMIKYKNRKKVKFMGLISVIVPVYNVARFLDMSLQSLQMQTYPYWQAVLVNDGSTDDSLKILQKYAKQDTRFIVINKENGGVSSARNAGLKKAGGEFIAFLDPDDMFYPQFLEIMLQTLINDASDIVLCDFKKCEESTTLDFCSKYSCYKTVRCSNLVKQFVYRKRPKVRIFVCAKIFRRNLLEGKTFYEDFKVGAEDFHFTMLLFSQIKKASFVCLKLLAYRQNSTSLTHRPISFELADDHILLLKELVSFYSNYKQHRIVKRLQRRLSRITYDYCCLRPYYDKSPHYIDFWRRYFPVIYLLKDSGVFDEKGLSWWWRYTFNKFLSGDMNKFEQSLKLVAKLKKYLPIK